jgi:hypothetical protein
LALSLPALGQSVSASQESSPPTAGQTGQQGGSNPPAQQPPATPAPTPTPQPASAPTWSAGPIDFSGLVDVYYAFNNNHPANVGGSAGCSTSAPATCGNQLYNFDVQPNSFSLNMLKLSAAHSPDPVGFQVDFGFGRAFDIIAATEPGSQGPAIFRNIEQAYASLKPAKWHGFEIDFGKFVTSDGAEVIETMNNWNYSRSLLFSWAVPYYHLGLRTSFPVGKHLTAGVMLVNGWNNVEDNNTGKTVMFTGTYTRKLFAWTGNYHFGPENPGTNRGWRHLFDTTLTLTPTSKVSAYINYDYGQNRCYPLPGSATCATTSSPTSAPLSIWTGVAGALHIQATGKWSFSARGEWFNDHNGFATGTNVKQHVKEVTLTGEYKMLEGLLARLEYRYDWSDVPFFNVGTVPATSKTQTTVALGVVAYFGPKR